MKQVVLYSKPGCCLCDEVKAQLKRLQSTHPFEWREMNILEEPDAFERFKEEIPVVFIDGKKAFKVHLNEDEFLKRLRR